MHPSPVVVELDVFEDRLLRNKAIFKYGALDQLPLKRPEERFGNGVIIRISFSRHRVGEAGIRKSSVTQSRQAATSSLVSHYQYWIPRLVLDLPPPLPWALSGRHIQSIVGGECFELDSIKSSFVGR